MDERAEQFALSMTEARADTLRLFDMAAERDLRESPGFGYRPLVWHLAHIGVFEAFWLLQRVLALPAPPKKTRPNAGANGANAADTVDGADAPHSTSAVPEARDTSGEARDASDGGRGMLLVPPGPVAMGGARGP